MKPLPSIEGGYQVITADPPWPYNNSQSHDPKRGGYTYPPMTMEQIKALPVESIAAEDSLLFLWATMPKLPQALEVIEAWGFRHVTTAFVWVKTNPKNAKIYSGMGYYTNGNAELVLIGKRGHPHRVRKDVKQIVIAPRSRHSAKPEEVRRRIDLLVGPKKRKLEMFARGTLPSGWMGWGLEFP